MTIKRILTNAVLLTVLLTFGFGCKMIGSPFGGGGISASTDPKEAVRIANKKFMDAKFYHSVSKTKTGQADLETEIDFNAPDRFWIKNNIPNAKSEVIAIGNESFTRLNDGKWSKMATPLPVADMRGKMTEESLAAMKDFEFAGQEDLNGKKTFVFKFKSTYQGESSSKMWVSADTGLPLKVETDGSYSGNNVQISITYDYDRETAIEVPKVVAEGPSK